MSNNTATIRLGITGADQITAAFRDIGSAISSTTRLLGPLAAGFAAFKSFSSFTSGITDIISKGKELSDLSARTGQSVQSLVVLGKAMKLVGGDAGSLTTALNLMQKEIVAAGENGGPAALALQRIGLRAQDLIRLKPEDQFREIYTAISRIENPTLRAATAMQIFGRSGKDLVPLFSRGGVLEEAERSMGAIPEILAKNAEAMRRLTLDFESIQNKPRQFFVGLLDQLMPVFQEGMKAIKGFLSQIDFVDLGRKFGAFVNVVIDYWKEGRIDEIIGLTIQAGFEAGQLAFLRFVEFTEKILSNMSFWKSIAVGLVAAFAGFEKIVFGVVQWLTGLESTVRMWLLDNLGSAFDSLWFRVKKSGMDAFNSLMEGLENKINEFSNRVANPVVQRLSKIPGLQWLSNFTREDGLADPNVKLPRITDKDVGLEPPKASLSFKEWREAFSSAEKEKMDEFSKSVDSLVDSFKNFIGVGNSDGIKSGNEGAFSQLLALINQRVAFGQLVDMFNRAKEALKGMFSRGGSGYSFATNVRTELRAIENELKEKLDAIEERRAKLDGDFTQTAAEKWGQRKQLLQDEENEIKKVIELLDERKADPSLTEDQRNQITTQQDSFRSKLTGVQRQKYGLGPDPNSIGEQISASMTSLREQMGTFSQNLGQLVAAPFRGLFESLQTSLDGLIRGTMTWGQALSNIGTGILDSVLQGFEKLVAGMIVNFILAHTVGSALQAASLAATAPIAAASAAMWATPAFLASVATGGAAVGVGGAALSAGEVSNIASTFALQSFAGFSAGGYTGDGPTTAIAGAVHRGEYVFPAQAVDRIGVPALDRMSAGATGKAASGGAAVGGTTHLNVVAMIDRDQLIDYRSRNFVDAVVGVMETYKHRI